ncbi:MAG: response regulator [Candidatus Moraniibacteriota bacterium]
MKKKKILIVDDKKENIDAAKVAIARAGLLRVAYASSTKEAIDTIITAYETDKTFFDLVISDLEMEKSSSGIEVAVKSAKYLAIPFIATERNGAPGFKYGEGHGPNTSIEPIKKGFHGKKFDPNIWEQIFHGIEEVCLKPPYKQILESLGSYKKFVGKPSDEIGKLILVSFDHYLYFNWPEIYKEMQGK